MNIEDILLDKVSVTLEQKGLTNNIQQVLDGMSTGEPEKEEATKKPGKKLLIKKLQINEVTVNVKLLPIPGKDDTFPMKLDPITMTDLGSEDKMDIAVLTSKILIAIAGGIAKQGAGILPDDIIGPLGDTLENLSAAADALIKEGGKVLQQGQETTKELLEDTKKVGDDLKKGIDGLLKTKDKEEK